MNAAEFASLMPGAVGRDGSWRARCPAHGGKKRSLSVREGREGSVLIRCWSHECDVFAIAESVGVKVRDLMGYRPRDVHAYPSTRHTIPAGEALALLDHEALVVAIIGADFLEHREIDEPTWTRLGQAVNRINKTRANVAPARVSR